MSESKASEDILDPPDSPVGRVVVAVVRVFNALLIWLLLLCILPVAVPISLGFRVYRYLLRAHIRRRYAGRLRPIAGSEALWLQDHENNRTIIDAVLLVSGTHDLESIRDLVLERVLDLKRGDGTYQFHRLRCQTRRILSCYVWDPVEDFHISDYVFEYEGVAPRGVDELRDVVSRLSSEQLPPHRSPWQMIIIPMERGDRFAIQMRVHHCIADGISLVKVLFSQFIDTEECKPSEAETRNKSSQADTRARYGALITWRTVLATIFYGPLLLIEQLCSSEDRHILHGPEPSGEKLVAWSDPVPLDWVKRIKSRCNSGGDAAPGTTINDILMTCVAGALARYLKESGAEHIPRDVSAAVPVDIGSALDRAELRLENKLTVVPLKLPTTPATRRDSVLRRLAEVRRRMLWVKRNPYHLINYLYTSYAMERFPDRVTSWVFDMVSNMSTTVLSNVPGPQEQLHFMGNHVDMMIFWPPQRGKVCLGISIFSYSGKVQMGVQCDTAVMTEPERVCREFNTQLALLSKQMAVPIPLESLIED